MRIPEKTKMFIQKIAERAVRLDMHQTSCGVIFQPHIPKEAKELKDKEERSLQVLPGSLPGNSAMQVCLLPNILHCTSMAFS